MQQSELDLLRENLPELLDVVRGILRLHTLDFLHQRTDHVCLMPVFDLIFDKCIRLVPIARIDHAVFDRKTLCRHLIHHRDVQIPIQDNGERSGDRCGAHHQNMRMSALFRKYFPLADAEAVLLIRDDERQVIVDGALLDQRVCSDHHRIGIKLQRLVCHALLTRRHGAGEKHHRNL